MNYLTEGVNMSDKPYYEQEYHEPASDIPDPSFGEIFKGLFLYPFTWAARSTRKAFWVSYAIQFVITLIIGIVMTLILFLTTNYSYVGNDTWTAVIHGMNFFTWLIALILLILEIWIKLGLLGYAVRRLHDADYSGWWLWLMLIPLGWIVVLIFLLLPTVEKPVRWGTYLFTH